MEALVSTAGGSAPLSFASVHRRRAPASVAVRDPARGWRCRCARPAAPDPVPSEEPASGSGTTVVVADKPAEEPEVGAVSDGSGGAVEATVVDAPVSSSVEAPEESAGVDDILGKLDIEVTPTYVLFGGGALLALLILSKIVSAIDSVPLLPKVLELIGTGYSVWFTAKYLLFKESRDELFAKFEDLKDRII
ncbi:protein CURVATURE THYLAKOID 1D, chloroplastic-like [Lolium rigidum]|uniref:protein CURVATURE THYLAKOID 1D, chloroplastic-like n=1 Tax=Lolium rigidum TaxID=89674 RepID=UPI001F5DF6D0|nr:protein CURVATURE THYLAKOID 1D, chloroplastic-like [Lolium rigidum]